MKRALLAVVLGLCPLPGSAVAQDWESFRVEARPLAPGVSLLSAAGGNLVACHGPEGVLLVDSEYAQLTPKLRAAVAALGAGPRRLLVNTHWHFDHVGGNAALAGDGATIIAHARVRDRMQKGQTIAIIDETIPPAESAALPTVTFTDSLTLHLNGETVDVWHLPGAHTDGDAVLRFRRADVLHVGDLWFHGGYPFIDISSGGHIDGLIAALDTLVAVAGDSTRVVPGHGPLGTKAQLAAHRDMLREFRDIVAREIAAGKDLSEIIAEKATARLDATWGEKMFPPAAFTEIVYRSLKGS